ncbi:MAG TPA: NADH-quinone oxidoreductase subunit C, partial [Stellaceae bacterium]|nr:NADH-quinone oxidoreductase subunit C [Stellaceae bacterium]
MSPIGEILGNAAPLVVRTQWRRATADEAAWDGAGRALAAGQASLLGLWGERGVVHLGLIDANSGEIAVLSFKALAGEFPSLGRLHPPAIRLERTIKDLFGLEPQGAPDARPWLDHGRWGVKAPLGS